MIEPPVSRPALSYQDALERAHAVMARDHDGITPLGRTALLEHGEERPWCVVLFHGFTNHPGQFVRFAPMLFDLGANVYVPRFPRHGHANRMTTALATLTAEELLANAYAAVDVAQGLGERVAVLGISMGGLLAAHAAQFREIGVAVPVAPDFSLLHLSYGASRMLGWALRLLPNFFMWWDPRVRISQHPATAYPRFATHALAQTLRIGDEIVDAARSTPPLATRIAAVVNAVDPAVNNRVTSDVVSWWRSHRPDGIEFAELTGLPVNHDIIDPDNPEAHTDVVYPKLIDALSLSRPATATGR
jgi:alpha-beta hydrolase superfamily lysophospholipase